jgi:hypothetical protein
MALAAEVSSVSYVAMRIPGAHDPYSTPRRIVV